MGPQIVFDVRRQGNHRGALALKDHRIGLSPLSAIQKS